MNSRYYYLNEISVDTKISNLQYSCTLSSAVISLDALCSILS